MKEQSIRNSLSYDFWKSDQGSGFWCHKIEIPGNIELAQPIV